MALRRMQRFSIIGLRVWMPAWIRPPKPTVRMYGNVTMNNPVGMRLENVRAVGGGHISIGDKTGIELVGDAELDIDDILII